MIGIVHFYPQACPKGQLRVIGDLQGIETVRDALNRALETGSADQGEIQTADGAPYEITISVLDDPKMWAFIQLPYPENAK